MCNNLQNLLNKKAIPNKTQNDIYTAIADDMNSITEKIDKNTKDITEFTKDVAEIKTTVNKLEQITNKIITKLEDDKIEEKAYIYETLHVWIKNKWFWVVVITITMLAGTGIITLLDRSTQIKQVVEAVK